MEPAARWPSERAAKSSLSPCQASCSRVIRLANSLLARPSPSLMRRKASSLPSECGMMTTRGSDMLLSSLRPMWGEMEQSGSRWRSSRVHITEFLRALPAVGLALTPGLAHGLDLNSFRAQHGKPALSYSATLAGVAQQ